MPFSENLSFTPMQFSLFYLPYRGKSRIPDFFFPRRSPLIFGALEVLAKNKNAKLSIKLDRFQKRVWMVIDILYGQVVHRDEQEDHI